MAPNRRTMSRARKIGAITLVLILAAGGLGWWWQTSLAAVRWTESVPVMPGLGAFPPEMRTRVAALTTHAAARDLTALGELARLYHANGFYREAALAYAGLEQLGGTDPRGLHLHAHLLAGMGRLADAQPRWQRAVALAPDYLPARVRWAEVMLKTNRASEAAEVYAGALVTAPQHPHVLLGLARCELHLGRLTAARERLQQAVAAQPGFGAGWNLLATIYERLGNTTGAVAAQERTQGLRRFRELADPWLDDLLHECYDVYRLRVAAGAANAAGDPRDAVPWLERAARLAPDDAAVQRDLGDVRAVLREFAAARVAFERAIALAPTHEAAYLRLAAVGTTTIDLDLAARALAAGVAQCPRSAGLWFAHGRQLAAAGRSSEALVALDEARKLQPDKADAYHEMASIYFRLGRDADGVAALEAVFAHAPDHVDTTLALAQRAVETGDEAMAVRWLGRVQARGSATMGRAETLVREFQRRFGRMPW